jgi:hypothetical protein
MNVNNYLKAMPYGYHMLIKGQWKHALTAALLWAAVLAVILYLIPEIFGQFQFWVCTVVSLFFLAVSVTAFFGRIRVFFLFSFPAIMFYSVIDTSKYNVEKASLVLGSLTAILSYALLFMLKGGLLPLAASIVAIIVFVIGCIYVFVSRRFKAEAQSKG